MRASTVMVKSFEEAKMSKSVFFKNHRFFHL